MNLPTNMQCARHAASARNDRIPDMNVVMFTRKLLNNVFDPIFGNNESKWREFIKLTNDLRDGTKQLKWADKDPKTLESLLYELRTVNEICRKTIPLWEQHGQQMYQGVQHEFMHLRRQHDWPASQYNLHMQMYYILLCLCTEDRFEPLFKELNDKEEMALLEEGFPKKY